MARYKATRTQLLADALNAGRVLRIPTSGTLTDRLGGTWTAAKTRAGLMPAETTVTSSTRPYRDAEVIDDTVQAFREEGPGLSRGRVLDVA